MVTAETFNKPLYNISSETRSPGPYLPRSSLSCSSLSWLDSRCSLWLSCIWPCDRRLPSPLDCREDRERVCAGSLARVLPGAASALLSTGKSRGRDGRAAGWMDKWCRQRKEQAGKTNVVCSVFRCSDLTQLFQLSLLWGGKIAFLCYIVIFKERVQKRTRTWSG